MAGYLIEERRSWPVITASPRVIQNLEGKAFSDEGKPYQSPGRMKNSSYYIAPVGDRTHDLPHTVASNMVTVSHALTHSATAAVKYIEPGGGKTEKLVSTSRTFIVEFEMTNIIQFIQSLSSSKVIH